MASSDHNIAQLHAHVHNENSPQLGPTRDQEISAKDFLTFSGVEIPESNRSSSSLFQEMLSKKPFEDSKKMLDCPTPRFWALNPIKIGVFQKQGFHHRQWQRRLFAIEGHYLYYYEQETDPIPRGVILLDGALVEEDTSAGKGKDHKYCFSITAKKSWQIQSLEVFETRKYWFSVGSAHELNDWVALVALISYGNSRYASDELW